MASIGKTGGRTRGYEEPKQEDLVMIAKGMRIVSAAAVAAAVGGCAMQQQQVEESLQDPRRINCRTADGDIRVLQAEKTSLAQQIAEGATAIYPAGIVVGVATGTEATKLSVATGDYNQMIDDRIAEIRAKCGR